MFEKTISRLKPNPATITATAAALLQNEAQFKERRSIVRELKAKYGDALNNTARRRHTKRALLVITAHDKRAEFVARLQDTAANCKRDKALLAERVKRATAALVDAEAALAAAQTRQKTASDRVASIEGELNFARDEAQAEIEQGEADLARATLADDDAAMRVSGHHLAIARTKLSQAVDAQTNGGRAEMLAAARGRAEALNAEASAALSAAIKASEELAVVKKQSSVLAANIRMNDGLDDLVSTMVDCGFVGADTPEHASGMPSFDHLSGHEIFRGELFRELLQVVEQPDYDVLLEDFDALDDGPPQVPVVHESLYDERFTPKQPAYLADVVSEGGGAVVTRDDDVAGAVRVIG